MKNILKILSLFCFFLLLISSSHAYDSFTGTTRGSFLKLNNSVRAAAMGDSYIAVSDDNGAVFFNPAGLSQINSTQISSMYSNWLGGITFANSAVIIPRDKTTMGFSLNYYNLGAFEETTLALPKGTGRIITPLASEFIYSLVRKVDPYSSYGGNFKIIYERISDISTVGYSADLGALWQIASNLTLGLTAKNIVSPLGEVASYKNYGAGISYKSDRLLLNLDVNSPNDNKMSANIGGEFNLKSILFARAGFNTRNEENAGGSITGGLGLKLHNIKIDYAYVPYSDLGITHRVSVALSLVSKKDSEITQFEIIPKVEKYILGKYYLLEVSGYNNRLNKVDIAPSWEVSGGEIKKSERGSIIFKASRIGKGYIKATQNNSSFTEKINISN